MFAGNKPFKCEACGKKFREKSNWTSHLRIHSGKSKKWNIIQSLGYKFDTEFGISFSGERPFVCQICDARFVEKIALVRHSSFHTGKQRAKTENIPLNFLLLLQERNGFRATFANKHLV